MAIFRFFLLYLCIGHRSSHSTYKLNFWYVGSIWHGKSKKNIFLLKIFIFDDFSDIVKCHWKLKFLKKTIKSSKMKMKTVYIFFALSISYWTYIPKIRVVGQMGWPVENTKIKRKNMKNCPKIDNFQKFKIFILHLFKTNWNTHLFQSTCFYMQRGLSKIEICWVQKWWERL